MREEPEGSKLPPSEYDAAADYQAAGLNKDYSGSLRYVKIIGLLAILVAGCGLLLSQLEWTKGRPLRGRGRKKLRIPGDDAAPAHVRAGRHWISMAAEEHESVATFHELAADLTAAGAPASLVERCRTAALEEERHTQLCVSVAEHVSGQPAAVPDVPWTRRSRRRPRWRTALLVRLAVESLVDGCVGEASSAWVLGRMRKSAGSDRVRQALGVLAREEMGHAQLGRDIVRWCCEEGGAPVRAAVATARARMRAMAAPRVHSDPDLAEFGVPDDALRAAGFEWSRRRLAA